MDVSHSRRVNSIQRKYIPNLAAASETAETLLESLQKGKKEGGCGSDQFFQTSAVNFLAVCIYFFVSYELSHTTRTASCSKQKRLWTSKLVVRNRQVVSLIGMETFLMQRKATTIGLVNIVTCRNLFVPQ